MRLAITCPVISSKPFLDSPSQGLFVRPPIPARILCGSFRHFSNHRCNPLSLRSKRVHWIGAHQTPPYSLYCVLGRCHLCLQIRLLSMTSGIYGHKEQSYTCLSKSTSLTIQSNDRDTGRYHVVGSHSSCDKGITSMTSQVPLAFLSTPI